MVETEFSQVRFKGDTDRARSVYRGIDALTPQDIAEAAAWVASRPERVTIQEMVIYPTAQASTSQIFRQNV
jgi:NADP-dependent 3-hydroxy acid dehydrogenase YdfG